MQEAGRRARWVWPALVVWSLATSAGLLALVHYSSRPGDRGSAPATWPAETGLAIGRDCGTLLMFVHPRCPCTAASIAELARLMARARDRLDAVVALYVPSSEPAVWSTTRTAAAAAAIPGVRTEVDRDGVLARAFGARTSGHVVVYDRQGRLWFSGGITAGRGHEGDNAGRDAIEARLAGEGAGIVTTAVFGCELFAPAAACAGDCPGGGR